jgi:NhaA family Na+:H+ antiporter
LGYHWYYNLASPNSLGIISGLVLGKPLGILLFCWLITALGWAVLPKGISWKALAGVAILGGIGFTMSIFISNLAFTDAGFIRFSKLSVLVASGIASVLGLLMLALSLKKRATPSP